MVRVGVLGGGTAGVEAAQEAAISGAEVTLIERSEKADLPWEFWPDLIGRPPRGGAGRARPEDCCYQTLRATATSVGSRQVTLSTGARHSFDRVILCTGSAFVPPTLRGVRKSGVHVLDSAEGYACLRDQCASSENVVVCGEGFRGLAVSEGLAAPGRIVHIVATRWRHGTPSGPVLDVIKRSARRTGVILTEGSIAGAFGSGQVEAAVTNGSAIKCEALILIPERTPRVIPTDAIQGPEGGALVDGFLRTTAEGTLAAGGCAEIRNRSGVSTVLDEEPGMSGRVAGSNCVGGKTAVGKSRFLRARAFGLRFATTGLSQDPPSLFGSRFGSVSRSRDSSACTIVYERLTGRVSSVQLVEPTEEDSLVYIPSVAGESLHSIAYGGLGSSDISLLADTARQGLRVCQRS